MTKSDQFKTRINKITLFTLIFSIIFNILQVSSSPIFKNFFKGKIDEYILKPTFPEKYRNNSYYLTVFKYKHISGDPIHKITLSFLVKNTGASIDVYEPYFKTLYNKQSIKQEKDKNYLKIEIDEIRPNDEFDVKLYSKQLSDISSSIIMEDGSCVNSGNDTFIRKPVYWIAILIIAFFGFFLISFRRSIKILENEKHRIIGERDALQKMLLHGEKLSSRSDEK